MLDARSAAAVAVPLLALAVAGWYFSIRQAGDMSGMITGLGQIGSRMPNDVAWPAFMVMWLGMMAAMMLPAIGSVVIAQRATARERGEGALVTLGFVATYLVVWLLIGLVPLLAFVAFRNLPMEPESSLWLQIAGGLTLVAAGVHQFTPWKNHSLRACRSPLGFVNRHQSTGPGGALRAGALYGMYCVGSCWALMAVLLVVGLMNLVWMAAIALVFLAEKNWRHGALLARAAGVGLAALGVAVVFVPSLLSAISG
jgi:predicted metal-binding membrane protein